MSVILISHWFDTERPLVCLKLRPNEKCSHKLAPLWTNLHIYIVYLQKVYYIAAVNRKRSTLSYCQLLIPVKAIHISTNIFHQVFLVLLLGWPCYLLNNIYNKRTPFLKQRWTKTMWRWEGVAAKAWFDWHILREQEFQTVPHCWRKTNTGVYYLWDVAMKWSDVKRGRPKYKIFTETN